MGRWWRVVTGITGRGVRESALRRAVAGRVVLVTGASEGIGAATARRLGAARAVVLLVARTAARLERVRAEIEAAGGTAHAHPCDLADPVAARALAGELIRRYRRVDVVVSNAGRSIRRSVTETADRFHDVRRTADINYLGPVALLLGLLPAMRAARRGHVVNVSTASLAVSAPGWSAYLASKVAFDFWLRCAAPELRLDGVTVSTVYCGLVRTRMSAPTIGARRVPAATPEEAAAVVCRAVARRPRTVWPWWARIGEVPAVAFKGSVERLFAGHLRASRALSGPRALRDAGALSPAALARAGRARRRYGATLAAAFAAGPGTGLALVDRDGPMTAAELDAAATESARHLAPLAGTGRVGLACGPGRGFVIAAVALGRLGVDTVLLPPDTPPAVLPELVAAQEIRAIVQDGRYDAAPVPLWHWHSTSPSGTARVPVPPRAGRLTVLTSGTTGAPKAVHRALAVRTLLGPVGTHLRLVPLRPGKPVVLAAPPHHGYGLAYLAACLALGTPVLLAADLTPRGTLDLAAEHHAETLVALPIQLGRLATEAAATPAGSGSGVTGLRAIVSGAAPLSAELHALLVGVFGDIVYNLYGTTEAGWAAIATPADLAAAPGTVGRPPHGVRLVIRDADGRPLPPGEVGEVHVSGWLPGNAEIATGDLGHLDPVGRLLLHGRTDRMIVSGGVNVYPEPVAAILASHPDIASVDVSAVPDPEYGQRLAARIRLRPGASVTADDIRAWQRERLSPAQRPRDILLDQES